MSKKIRKTVAKFDIGHKLVKQFGLPDPAGDALYGEFKALSPQEAAAAAAEKAEANALTGAPASAPTAVDPAAVQAREDQRKRQLAASGLSANVLTGAGGLSSKAKTQMKSLLGS